MRRVIVLLLTIATFIVGNAFAQSYPEELAGDQFFGAMTALQFYPTEQYQLPWSVPIDQSVYWKTNIASSELPLRELNVFIECIADRSTGECIWAVGDFNVYGWDAEAKSYVQLFIHPSGDASIDCYTWQYYHWRHYTGLLEYTGSPPQWWDWGWYTLDVAAPGVAKLPEHQHELATE